MDTIWTWGWCLIPLIFFGILAVAFLVGGRRCGCGCARPHDDRRRDPPGPLAQ